MIEKEITVKIPLWLPELFMFFSGIIAIGTFITLSTYFDNAITSQDVRYHLAAAFILVTLAGMWYLSKIKISYQQGLVSFKLP